MTTFDERERGEEGKFQHDQELAFKARNRRNKLFGLWIAQDHLGLSGERLQKDQRQGTTRKKRYLSRNRMIV